MTKPMTKYTEHPERIQPGAHNREIKEHHVRSLMEDIRRIGFMRSQAVVVARNGRTLTMIEGHHRREACMRLGVGIWYTEAEAELTTLPSSWQATTLPWTLTDHHYAFCSSGHRDYLKLRDLMGRHQLPLSSALYLASGIDSGTWRAHLNKFRKGEYVYHEPAGASKRTLRAIEAMKANGSRTKDATNGTMVRALLQCCHVTAFDLDVFIDRLERASDPVVLMTTVKDCVTSIAHMYNHKARGDRRIPGLAEIVTTAADQRRRSR